MGHNSATIMKFINKSLHKAQKFIFVFIFLMILSALSTAILISFKNNKIAHFNTQILNPLDIFNSEEDYQNFITQTGDLDTLSFAIITVTNGDNFWKIAKDSKVNIDTLLGANPFWKSINASTGQKIIVPSEKGTLCFIDRHLTLQEAAELFNTEAEKIVLKQPDFLESLKDGDKPFFAVFIRDGKPSADNMTDSMAEQFVLREKFHSPLGGRLSSYFGGRVHPIFRKYGFHNGIDIASHYGTPVGASCAGTVQAAGWMGGYGKAVIVIHDGGYKTLYGHLSSIAVSPGQKVRSQQFIGRVGSTGYSTGPHLHFTLWHNEKLINPMKVLW